MPGDPFLFLSSDVSETTTIYTQEQIDKYKASYIIIS